MHDLPRKKKFKIEWERRVKEVEKDAEWAKVLDKDDLLVTGDRHDKQPADEIKPRGGHIRRLRELLEFVQLLTVD